MNTATIAPETSDTKAEPAPSTTRLEPTDLFVPRHIGPNDDEVGQMLQAIGAGTLDELIDQTVPASIRLKKPLRLGPPRGERETLEDLRKIAAKNKVFRSFIGMGYYDTITPPVIQRNILENPGWYTQYTPYQAEIAQGRLEALLNFQTMVADLTALPLANASLLDEATAAAEAMAMAKSIAGTTRNTFLVDGNAHPQTIAVVQTRARSMGINLRVSRPDHTEDLLRDDDVFGVFIQHFGTDGRRFNLDALNDIVAAMRDKGAIIVMATDLLACTITEPPGELGADIAVGSSQRFGVPLGFGGPHAAFMATKNEYARKMPGRIVGVSKDAQGNVAYRLAIQTREQHIRRERATSNICTAQVLLAIMASMYAVYHGPQGLKRIARRVHALTSYLHGTLQDAGYAVHAGHAQYDGPLFDTVVIPLTDVEETLSKARSKGLNFRKLDDRRISISLDETTTIEDVRAILELFGAPDNGEQAASLHGFERTSSFLTHPVFNTHHSETEMLRYIRKLESRDLSLAHSMIPLGSCTMKLNATSEMLPVSWPEFSRMHPFAPAEQTKGYQQLFKQLEKWLAEITGLKAVSLQPNAGSQGEYAGLLAIRGYHESRGDTGRDVCLIPTSAHGTNPASAVIAGFKVISVACDRHGNVDVNDLRAKAKEHESNLGALMITYPSTHGVFEPEVKEICKIVHQHGGQVYMDGANMNAQVGLTSPGAIGADVCHLNLHKTFCIPHGGGGPGMGPIAVAKHLAPFLPSPPLPAGEGRGEGARQTGSVGPVSAASYGSPSILTISWMYIAMMGADGLKRATEVAILNANYMAKRLEGHYDVLYRGKSGRCAHEFILDLRPFEKTAGVKVEDVAKRLIDYGFHAPTMSFPVGGTLMIEPTESESKAELDRFCDAMIRIRDEIREIEDGKADRTDNVLKNAPHTIAVVSADAWNRPYSREKAAFPAVWLRDGKFWPAVGRIDNPYGDRNLFCTCPPVGE